MAKQPKPNAEEISPDSLLNDFRGRPVVSIAVFTIIVHAILVGVFSIGYLKASVLGDSTEGLSEEERMDVAVREATKSLREIAERHGMNPQEFSSHFAEKDSISTSPSTTSEPISETASTPSAEPVPGQPGATDATDDKPKSAIEQKLEEKAAGPELPDLNAIEEEDDLF